MSTTNKRYSRKLMKVSFSDKDMTSWAQDGTLSGKLNLTSKWNTHEAKQAVVFVRGVQLQDTSGAGIDQEEAVVCELGLAARNQAGKYGSVNSEQTYRQRLLLESSENVDFVDVVENRGVNRTDNRDFPEAFFVPGDSANQINYAAEVKKVKNRRILNSADTKTQKGQLGEFTNLYPAGAAAGGGFRAANQGTWTSTSAQYAYSGGFFEEVADTTARRVSSLTRGDFYGELDPQSTGLLPYLDAQNTASLGGQSSDFYNADAVGKYVKKLVGGVPSEEIDRADLQYKVICSGFAVGTAKESASVAGDAFFVQLTAASILEHQAASFINHCPRHQMSTIFEPLGGSGKGMLLQVFLYDGAMRGFKVVGLGDGYKPGDILVIPVGTPLLTAPRQAAVYHGGTGDETHDFSTSRANVMIIDEHTDHSDPSAPTIYTASRIGGSIDDAGTPHPLPNPGETTAAVSVGGVIHPTLAPFLGTIAQNNLTFMVRHPIEKLAPGVSNVYDGLGHELVEPSIEVVTDGSQRRVSAIYSTEQDISDAGMLVSNPFGKTINVNIRTSDGTSFKLDRHVADEVKNRINLTLDLEILLLDEDQANVYKASPAELI